MAKFITNMKNKISKMNENSFILSNPDNMYAIKSYTDTGCYVLNAVLSDGDINKGLPDGKRTMLAGPSSSAKSFLICQMIKAYLIEHTMSLCFLFESEGSSIIEMAKDLDFTKDMMDRIIVIPVETVEDVITQFTNILDEISNENEKNKVKASKATKKKPFEYVPVRAIGVLDSLGMLSTIAEQASALDGTNKADAGRRNKLIKSLARTITMKISKVNIPFVVANHVYANIGGYGGANIISGGGVHYMQDIMLLLYRSKDKEPNKDQIGNIINVKVHKSRYMQENKKVKIYLNFATGMKKFSNIVEIGQKCDIIEKSGKEFYLIDGEEIKMKAVKQNPEKYITAALLQKIGKVIQQDFSFGVIEEDEIEEVEGDRDER